MDHTVAEHEVHHHEGGDTLSVDFGFRSSARSKARPRGALAGDVTCDGPTRQRTAGNAF